MTEMLLQKLKFYHRAHKSHTVIPILSQLNPVHKFSSYCSKIHFNTMLIYIWDSSFTLRFSDENFVHIPSISSFLIYSTL